MRIDQAESREPRADVLAELINQRRRGDPVGVTSVCSAHTLVLEATMREAATRAGPVLVEATSNQVDQTGGYTGLRPPDFRELVLGLARAAGVDSARVILGGDHLGPNRWRTRPAAEAMELAVELVETYARAGFAKLHLDCSMPCADDPARLDDAVVSERAARLLAAAEQAAVDPEVVSYVIGTEVPVPGGAAEAIESLRPTSAAAAAATLEAQRGALEAVGCASAWERVRGLVVQPGVEFDEWAVIDYDPSATGRLREVLQGEPGLVFEAHSTDYQTPDALAALVRDGWAILKVGPGLTFALREALFALEAIEAELFTASERTGLRAAVERAMLAAPGHWASHHAGEESRRRLARAFSLSDRMRYYWPEPAVAEAEQRLLAHLSEIEIPLPLLSQYLPLEYRRVRDGRLEPSPRALVLDHIGAVLRDYSRACGEEGGRA